MTISLNHPNILEEILQLDDHQEDRYIQRGITCGKTFRPRDEDDPSARPSSSKKKEEYMTGRGWPGYIQQAS